MGEFTHVPLKLRSGTGTCFNLTLRPWNRRGKSPTDSNHGTESTPCKIPPSPSRGGHQGTRDGGHRMHALPATTIAHAGTYHYPGPGGRSNEARQWPWGRGSRTWHLQTGEAPPQPCMARPPLHHSPQQWALQKWPPAVLPPSLARRHFMVTHMATTDHRCDVPVPRHVKPKLEGPGQTEHHRLP